MWGRKATVFNTVRLKYWPLEGRNIALKVIHECVDCFKANPVIATQIMGDLPAERVTPSPPFLNVGLDVCGPFEIKYKGHISKNLHSHFRVYGN